MYVYVHNFDTLRERASEGSIEPDRLLAGISTSHGDFEVYLLCFQYATDRPARTNAILELSRTLRRDLS